MNKPGKFFSAIVIETIAVVAIFYALGVARNITARELAEERAAETAVVHVER